MPDPVQAAFTQYVYETMNPYSTETFCLLTFVISHLSFRIQWASIGARKIPFAHQGIETLWTD